MPAAASPTRVRELVVANLRRLADAQVADETVVESLLIRDGKYRGRSYRAHGLMAMWLIETGLVQFYGKDGDLAGAYEVVTEAPGATKTAA